MEFSRETGWNFTSPWPSPESPVSMIFSSSPTIGSGVLFCTGYMPTDCPRSQSTSKLRTVSMADWRSLPVPTTIRSLPLGSVRMAPGRVAKPSRSFVSVVPETYCSGITVRPYPGSALPDPLVDRSDSALIGGRDAVTGRVPDHDQIVGAQCALEHKQHVLLLDRPTGGETDRTLDSRVDHIANAEDIAEHRLRHLRYGRVLKVQRVAAPCSFVDGVAPCPSRSFDIPRPRGLRRGGRRRRQPEK